MKNRITQLMAAATVTLSVCVYAQSGRVGVNTTSPQSTLDVMGKLGATDADGMQAPRLTLAQLTAKGNALYGTGQTGAMVYITDISGGDTAGQRVNITNTGYYYFDGSVWNKVTTGAGGGTLSTADNGLTAAGSNVQLGGTLIKPTTVATDATNQLTITGPTTGGLKYVDGNQAVGKVLMTDANGVATWKTSSDFTLRYASANPYPTSIPRPASGQYYTFSSFTVPVAGIYQVRIDLSVPALHIVCIDIASNPLTRSEGDARLYAQYSVYLTAGTHNVKIFNDASLSTKPDIGPYANVYVYGPTN